MMYFTNTPYTPETLKGEYRVLCKRLHPDTGGDGEAFKEMLREYEAVRRSVGSTAGSGRQGQDHERRDRSRSASSGFRRNPGTDEESRYRHLSDLLTSCDGYSGQDRDACLSLLRRLAALPFTSARVRYYGFYRLLKVEMDFAGAALEVKVEKFVDSGDKLSYTIYSPDMMCMSTATIDVIIDEILKRTKEK